MQDSFDVVVVGGGLVGKAAAVTAARLGYRCAHLAPPGPPDRRTSALMGPSVAFLQQAGLIEMPEAIGHPLKAIRIIDATDRLVRAPETFFDSAEAGLTSFGWNFANQALGERFETIGRGEDRLVTIPALARGFARTPDGWVVTLADGRTLNTSLLVGADGKRSPVRGAAGLAVRERKFAQSALVCDLDLGRPLDGTSVEFHYANGPFTLVPAGDRRANLVWIDNEAVLTAARGKPIKEMQDLFAAKAMRLFGAMTIVSPVQVFPLSTLTVSQAGAEGVMLVGESAHAFPPIGAQGLNLGLRDVADMAAILRSTSTAQAGWAQAAGRDYARERQSDLLATGQMVDALFQSLLQEMLPAQALRAGGLWALKLMPGLRWRAFALGMGSRG